MNCKGCLFQYNETDRSPRLLISCGHSICEKCTAELYREGQITCPECRFKNLAPMVTCFPRNLALININKQASITNNGTPGKGNQSFQSNILLNSNATQLYVNKDISQTPQQQQWLPTQGYANTSQNTLKTGNYVQQEMTAPVIPQSQQQYYAINTGNSDLKTESNVKETNLLSERFAICQKHFKKYEAYCEDDQQLLCITCILEDGHRQHQIDSIETSVQKQKQKQSDYFDQSRMQEKKAISIMQQIDSNLKDLGNQAQSQLQDICSFFSEMKKIINERESQLKNKVQDALLDQENQMKKLEKYYQNHIYDINEFQTFFRQSSVIQDVEYLKSLSKSKQLINKLSSVQQVDKIEFKQISSYFSKDSEIHTLAKQILQQSQQNHQKQHHQQHQQQQQQLSQQQQILQAQLQLPQTKKQLSQNTQPNLSSTNNNQQNNSTQPSNSSTLNINPQTPVNNQQPNYKKFSTQYQPSAQVKLTKKRVQTRKEVASIGPLGATSGSSNINRTKSNQTLQKKDQNKEILGLSSGISTNIQQQISTVTVGSSSQHNLSKARNDRSTSNTNPSSLNNYHELRNILKEKLTQQNIEQNPHRNDKISLTPTKRVSNYSNSSHSNDNLTFFNKEKTITNISPLRSNNITNIQVQKSGIGSLLKQNNQTNEVIPLNSQALYGGSTGFQSNDKANHQENFQRNDTNNRNNFYPSSTSPNKYGQTDDNDDQNFQFIDNLSFPETARKDLFGQNSVNKLNFLGSGQKLNSNTNSIMNSNNLMKSMRTDITDMFMNRCDFSTITTHQTGSYIYVFGGFIESSQYAIERFDIQRNVWEQVDNLPTNRAKFSVVGLENGNILIIGGKQDGMRIALCEEYDPRANKLTISNMILSSPKSGFGSVNIGNDKIIVVGGNDGQTVQDAVELYDRNSSRLPKKLCNMIEKRDELAVTLGLDQKIYAIGGFGGSKNICLRTAERYDPEKDKWEQIANLNVPRRALAAVTLPDGIYAIGGFDGQNYLSSVEKYDESLNQWIFISSMNFPRCTLSSVTSKDNQYIYVLGGFDNGPLDTVERYNVVEDKWEMYSHMSYRRFMHSSILINGQFF